MKQTYSIFGLNIRSVVPLPAKVISNEVPPDVVIDYGDTPENLSCPQSKNPHFQAAPGEFLLSVSWLGRYYIREGRTVTITPNPGASEDWILVFLMGSAMGALLHQRHYLVLHAGAIRVQDAAVIFMGPSGIGKSTLAAGFHQRGCPLLADDVCAVALIDQVPHVIPGFLQLKLWGDTLNKIGKDESRLKGIPWVKDRNKYFLPVQQTDESPVALKKAFSLKTHHADFPSVSRLSGQAKIDVFIRNTYRLGFLHGMGVKREHFQLCAAVAASVKAFQVERPVESFHLDELMNALSETF